jgi:hypothetical protein
MDAAHEGRAPIRRPRASSCCLQTRYNLRSLRSLPGQGRSDEGRIVNHLFGLCQCYLSTFLPESIRIVEFVAPATSGFYAFEFTFASAV